MSRWMRLLRWLACAVIVVVGWSARPAALGGSTSALVVVGHSMDGTFHTGDLVVLRSQPRYHAGDVIGFRVPAGQAGAGLLVIHRISVVDEVGRYTTKGDNNARPDVWTTRSADVLGHVVLRVPAGGRGLAVLRSRTGGAALAGAIASSIAWGAPRGASPTRWRRRGHTVGSSSTPS